MLRIWDSVTIAVQVEVAISYNAAAIFEGIHDPDNEDKAHIAELERLATR